MNNNPIPANQGRRRFLNLFGSIAAVLPITILTGCGEETPPPEQPPKPASPEATTGTPAPEPEPAAVELQPLSLDDPSAQALGYQHDAADVDTQKFPQRGRPEAADQFCHNCALFLDGANGDWGPCALFPGKKVNANGWCGGYAPRLG